MSAAPKIATRRSLTYWAILLTFLLTGGPIMSADWVISTSVHMALDGMAVIFALTAATLLFRSYAKTRETILAILAVALAGTAAFEFIHAVSAHIVATESAASLVIPWSWNAARIYLSITLLVAVFFARRDNFRASSATHSLSLKAPKIVAVATVFTLSIALIGLVRTQLPPIYYASISLPRPLEVISGTLFLVAMLVFLRHGNWRTDSRGHSLNILLLLSVVSQFLCMTFSSELLDSSFAASHLLKLSSYLAIVYGFLTAHTVADVAKDTAKHIQPAGLGLGAKVAIGCGMLAFVSVMPTAIKSSIALHELAATSAINKLSLAATAASRELEWVRDQVDGDLHYLANMEVVQDLNSALENNGVTPVVGKKQSQITSELSELIKNLLLADSQYLNIAYFDAQDPQPIVQRDQDWSSGLTSGGEHALNDTAKRLAAQSLASRRTQPLARSGIFSVRINDAKVSLVESTASGVYSKTSDRPIGVFVVHRDVTAALTPATIANLATRQYVAAENGRIISGKSTGANGAIQGADALTLAKHFPGLNFGSNTPATPAHGTLYEQTNGNEIIIGIAHLPADSAASEPLVYIYTSKRDDAEKLAIDFGFIQQRNALIVLMMAIILGLILSRRLTKPVIEISAAAVEFGRSGTISVLPDSGRDEIGMLAKSLADMMAEVSNQRGKLVRLATAVESSVDSIIIADTNGQIEYVNPRHERYAGVTAEKLIGSPVSELAEYQGNSALQAEINAAQKSGEAWAGQIRTVRADGRIHDETITVSPTRNPQNEIVNYVTVVRDITERQQLAGQLKTTEARIQHLADGIPGLFAYMDLDYKIRFISAEYCELFRKTSDEIMGIHISELIGDELFAQRKQRYERAMAGETVHHEYSRERFGTTRHMTVTHKPHRDTNGTIIGVMSLALDITERREMQQNIESKSAELQRSNLDLEQFAYVASHDLKAPLRAIDVLVEWLKEDLEGFEGGDVQENLDLLKQRTKRLNRLLDDLLTYSRAGRKLGDVKAIHTKELVEDIATLIAPPEGFVIETDHSLPQITTHHAPLETVFRNLMGNAIKHATDPANGRIRVYAQDQGDAVMFAVEDNGIGIPEEYAKKVFKMFQTLKPRDDTEGSGMGLAIVQRIIDWQGGRIWFHAGPGGKGTVFKFMWNKTPQDMPDMDDIARDDSAASETQIQVIREAIPQS